jgi:membrane protein CcdC involved in cytochrome C biogenesis
MNQSPFVVPVLGLLAILAWRLQETGRAVSVKSITVPPLCMASGLSMFALPRFQVPWLWASGALAIGAVVLGYPLVRTSRLEKRGEVVMMHRTKALFAVILGLAAIRFLARNYVGQVLTTGQTAALAYLLALGMIVRWRAWMLMEYRALVRT